MLLSLWSCAVSVLEETAGYQLTESDLLKWLAACRSIGVRQKNGRCVARVTLNRAKEIKAGNPAMWYHLGYFDTEEEAVWVRDCFVVYAVRLVPLSHLPILDCQCPFCSTRMRPAWPTVVLQHCANQFSRSRMPGRNQVPFCKWECGALSLMLANRIMCAGNQKPAQRPRPERRLRRAGTEVEGGVLRAQIQRPAGAPSRRAQVPGSCECASGTAGKPQKGGRGGAAGGVRAR